MIPPKGCPPIEVLAESLERGTVEGEVAEHLRHCSDCSAVARIVVELQQADLVNNAAEYLDDVESRVQEIVNAPRHHWWELLREPRYRNVEVARRLLARGIGERWRDPRLAIDLTLAAARICDAIADSTEDIGDVHFEVWKCHSAFLRESGLYAACRTALRRATALAEFTSDIESARATMMLYRVLLASEPDVWEPDEALALLDSAERFFASCDPQRWRAARTARATLLYRLGDPACLDIYREVLAGTPPGDGAAFIDALANLIVARVEFVDCAPDVDTDLAKIEEYDRQRNASAFLARDQWVRGKLHALRHEHETAIEHFHRAALQYTLLDNQDAAVRLGFDHVASLLAMGRFEDALELCRSMAERSFQLDRRESTRRRALTAQVTAYQRELAQRYALTEDVALELRHYIRRITNQRPFPFLPPLPVEPV